MVNSRLCSACSISTKRSAALGAFESNPTVPLLLVVLAIAPAFSVAPVPAASRCWLEVISATSCEPKLPSAAPPSATSTVSDSPPRPIRDLPALRDTVESLVV